MILDNKIGALTKLLLVFLFITALLIDFTTSFCFFVPVCLSLIIMSFSPHHVFLSSYMQPAGSYAKVTNMINKIIADILGDGQEEVTLLQWWRVVLCSSFESASSACYHSNKRQVSTWIKRPKVVACLLSLPLSPQTFFSPYFIT